LGRFFPQLGRQLFGVFCDFENRSSFPGHTSDNKKVKKQSFRFTEKARIMNQESFSFPKWNHLKFHLRKHF
jgi:hypothetical protein